MRDSNDELLKRFSNACHIRPATKRGTHPRCQASVTSLESHGSRIGSFSMGEYQPKEDWVLVDQARNAVIWPR